MVLKTKKPIHFFTEQTDMDYYQFEFSKINSEESEILIAQLVEINFEGFEEGVNSLKALIPVKEFDESLFNSISEINHLKYSKSIIIEQNWNEKWESDFEPVLVNHPTTSKPFVFIRASFHKENYSFEYNIEVTPKMSFGTGHHATTYLMVANMSGIDFKNKTVIDFGTGTGVLAILAEKMGAKSVLAIDNDEWSINNARENIEVNNCKNTIILQAETIPKGNKADIILANINLNIIKENIVKIKDAALNETIFLFSGIMLHDEHKILEELTNAGMNIKNVFRREDWLSVLAVI